MAGLFQPKRVQVPGLLSDEGLAVALKNLSDTTKQGAEAAPPNTSAIEAADRITTEALKPAPGLRSVQSRISGQELSLSPEKRSEGIGQSIADYVGSTAIGQGAAAIAQAGALNPEQQAEEQKKIVEEAEAAGKAVTDTAALRDDVAEIIDRGRTGEGLMASQEELAAVRAGQSAQEASKATAFLKEAESTLPTQQWWLNAAQVGARSAIQMGSSALRYPADVWDTLDAIEKGSDTVKKSEVSIWLDGVDKGLTKLLPGDKARSKQFVTELSAGAGSMVGFMVTGWIGRTVGLPAALTTGTLGAAVEGDSLYQEADTFGATATQKLIALFAGSALGTTEAIPIDRAFMRADVASGGMIRQLLANTVSTSLEEFIQEASQTLGEDIIAKYGAAYDPNREINVDDIMRAGVIGAITGGTVGAATTLLSNGEEVDAVGMDETQITEAVDAALAQESQRFASIIGNELDGEGEVVAPAQGAGGQEVAGSAPATAGPDPVRGDAVQQIVENQAAFHGTPHKFDKFSMEKIGTGEGAQAFGHGLYFAGNKGTAQFYRDALAKPEVTFDGKTYNGAIDVIENKPTAQSYALSTISNYGTIDKAVEILTSSAKGDTTQRGDRYRAAVEWIGANRDKIEVAKAGALYQVDIPDDAELLDWDAPLREQPENIKAAFRSLGFTEGEIEGLNEGSPDYIAAVGAKASNPLTGEDAYRQLASEMGKPAPSGSLVSQVEPERRLPDDAAASAALLAAGIPGLRYLDAGSRTAGDGTRNYVIFDDSRITITDVEAQQAGLVTPDTMVAAADPTPNLDPLPGATGKPDPKAVQAVMAYAAASGLPITRQTEMRGAYDATLFHGTLGDFDAFDLGKAGSATEAWSAKRGIFLTSNLKLAEGYAIDDPYDNAEWLDWVPRPLLRAYAKLNEALLKKIKGKGLIEKGRILSVDVRLDNPLVIDMQGEEVTADGEGSFTARIDQANAEGYDGVIFRNARDPGFSRASETEQGDVVIIFDPAKARIVSKRDLTTGAVTPVQSELASLYTEMQHQPADPAVVATYQALVEEVSAQYAFAVAANGGELPPYPDAPVYPADHPLALVADQFWSLYQFFGTGLEGATDPENMWQAYARVFSASARPAFTTETRGPQGWSAVNGAEAPRKIGLMRSLAWEYNLDVEQVERMVAMQIENDLLRPIGQSRMIGSETAVLDTPELKVSEADNKGSSGRRSIRYVSYENGQPVSALQIMTDGKRSKKAVIQNIYTVEAQRRKGAAARLLRRAQQDFDVRHSDDLTNDGRAFKAADGIEYMTGTATVRQPYLAEQTRPTKGIPTPSPNPGNQEDVRLSSISRDFVKVLRLTARHGRLAAKDSTVMGEYNRRTAAIRLRTWTDLSTLVHEGGHALNDSMAAPLNAFVQANLLEIKTIARTFYAGDLSKAPDETVRREGFAEFFRVYTLNPRFARNRWPQLVDAFETVLKANDPQILDGLGSISAQFDAWLQLPSKQLIRNMIVDGRRLTGIQAAVKELKDQGFKTWMQEHARRQVGDLMRGATSTMLNRYVAVADLEAQLLNLGEQNRGAPLELQRSESPTAILRLARNSGSRAQVQITDGVIGYRSTQSISRGLREALMTALGIPPDTTPGSLDENLMKDFDAYIVARRAWDEYRRFDAGEIERPPIGAQKGDVVRTIKEYEQSQPQFIPAAQIVHEYGMAMWQKRFDAGLMDKDTYEEGLQRQFYAPLQRDVSDKQGTGADSIGFGSSVLTKGPRFRGSDRDIISPMTVLMQMTFALEKQISENDAKRALAILADRAGQAGALVERIPASQLIGQSFSVQQVAQRLTADAGLTAADASDLMTILAGSVDKGDLMTLFRSEQAGTQGENVIFFWENGKVAAVRLNDSSLASDVVNTMNAVGRENMDVLLEGVAATSTVFRTAITSWPDFLVVNYIRDQMSAWILGGTGYVPFATGIQGISDEIRQKQWAKSYNAAGGTLGGMTVAALHRTRVDRDIRALRAKGYTANVFGDADGGWSNVPGAIKGLARFTAITETGTRLGLYRGAYERAIKDGLSEYDASVEAAYIATDYIDFGLNGSKMLHVRRLVPFLNAQLQGLYKMYRTLGGDEVARRKGLGFALSAYFKNINNLPLSRLEQQQLRTGRAAWLKMMALGLIGAAIWAIFKDDPDYQEAGEYLRTTGWVIPTGDGKIFYIPKPFELAIVSNAVERGLEFATGDSTAIDRFKRGLVMTLTPPTAPPGLLSIVEVASNFDFFTGKEIVPNYMQALAPQLQYDNYTSSIAKWVGGVTGQSPLVVDHIMSGLGASAYRDISTMLNAADPTRPMPDETEWPILRRFVRDVRRGSASAQDFWAQASNTNGKLERGKATYKQYMDMGNEPAANRFLSTLNADERAYAVLMTDFKPEEKRLNPFYRARQVTTIVSDMRRQNSGEGLEDTTLTGDMSGAEIKAYMAAGNKLERFQMARGLRTQVDDILSEVARREVRNTMIATGQPGWQDKEVLPLEPTLDMLLAVSPDTYDEYQRRRVKAKVYDAQSVYDYWPEVRDRLNSDGPDAVLSDAVAVAGVVF